MLALTLCINRARAAQSVSTSSVSGDIVPLSLVRRRQQKKLHRATKQPVLPPPPPLPPNHSTWRHFEAFYPATPQQPEGFSMLKNRKACEPQP
jgi:hypothetical protein